MLETLYLGDHFTCTARFPSDITGGFDATYWSDKITLQVIAENTHDFHLPTPQQLDVTCNSGTLSTQTHLTKKAESPAPLAPVGKQNPSRKASKVLVFLVHLDDQEIVKTHDTISEVEKRRLK